MTSQKPRFVSTYRGARISARKVRPLATMVRGMFADEALDTLRFQSQRGARMLEKAIKSAVGNAQDPDQNNGVSHRIEELVVTLACVDGGPMFKRFRPRARGSAFQIKKRSSHIRVGLTPINEV